MKNTVEENIEHPKLSLIKVIARVVLITLGALLMAVGLEVFLVPNYVVDGGITGISIMLAHLSGLRLGVFLFLLNLPFVYLGYKQIGKTFAISTTYGITMLSFFTVILHHAEAFTDDVLLATVFGGMLIGIGVGIVIRSGGALDGTEILAILISKKAPLSVGNIVMFFNFFILGTAGFVFTWDRAMYSLLTYYIASKAIDAVVEGFEQTKSVWIISDFSKEIADSINARLGRGVTFLQGTGAYSGDDKRVIFVVINRIEESKLTRIVQYWDPDAFLAIGDIAEVRGGQFKKKDIH
ncbi:YitT family protein [Mesobacillus maritimus]|uniref:YitT family protein n=1 Tax=Mesobacillus maritimus TaxID=1643336 RepID=UPI00203D4047|nr:YitT family protein [Mesobacillus maritimus]MCM3584206.1 YitT family protein [Mesobacillus maritimus]MCM3669333.1 YitT family protein [Mesobacillus maritimus]